MASSWRTNAPRLWARMSWISRAALARSAKGGGQGVFLASPLGIGQSQLRFLGAQGVLLSSGCGQKTHHGHGAD